MRVRSKELLAMPLGRVHYFVSKPRSDVFSCVGLVSFRRLYLASLDHRRPLN